MKDIGYVILDLKANQQNNQIIDYANKSQSSNCYKQDIIFSTNCDLIIAPQLPILHVSQSKFFYGNLFLFDINSVLLTSKSPNIENRYFYAQDIPWVKSSNTNEYSYWYYLFSSSNLQIIAANQQIYDIYNICWKKPIGISETFDYETIQRFLQ